jgi:hypothetical protein
MAKFLLVAVSLFVLLGVGRGQARGGFDPNVGVPLITDVLTEAGVSGYLEYWGSCASPVKSMDFPKFKAPRSRAGTPVEILREMFADHPKMQVTQKPNGTILMVETDVPQDILNLKIDDLSFDPAYEKLNPHAFNSPGGTLWFILDAPEVRAFVKAADIGVPPSTALSLAFSPRSQRIAGDLHEVTFSQALDYMLETFPGLVTYQNCPSQKNKRAVVFEIFSSGAPAGKSNRAKTD